MRHFPKFKIIHLKLIILKNTNPEFFSNILSYIAVPLIICLFLFCIYKNELEDNKLGEISFVTSSESNYLNTVLDKWVDFSGLKKSFVQTSKQDAFNYSKFRTKLEGSQYIALPAYYIIYSFINLFDSKHVNLAVTTLSFILFLISFYLSYMILRLFSDHSFSFKLTNLCICFIIGLNAILPASLVLELSYCVFLACLLYSLALFKSIDKIKSRRVFIKHAIIASALFALSSIVNITTACILAPMFLLLICYTFIKYRRYFLYYLNPFIVSCIVIIVSVPSVLKSFILLLSSTKTVPSTTPLNEVVNPFFSSSFDKYFSVYLVPNFFSKYYPYIFISIIGIGILYKYLRSSIFCVANYKNFDLKIKLIPPRFKLPKISKLNLKFFILLATTAIVVFCLPIFNQDINYQMIYLAILFIFLTLLFLLIKPIVMLPFMFIALIVYTLANPYYYKENLSSIDESYQGKKLIYLYRPNTKTKDVISFLKYIPKDSLIYTASNLSSFLESKEKLKLFVADNNYIDTSKKGSNVSPKDKRLDSKKIDLGSMYQTNRYPMLFSPLTVSSSKVVSYLEKNFNIKKHKTLTDNYTLNIDLFQDEKQVKK